MLKKFFIELTLGLALLWLFGFFAQLFVSKKLITLVTVTHGCMCRHNKSIKISSAKVMRFHA